MEQITRILNEIITVTLEIETKCLEIYKFLEEDITSLPFKGHP